MADNLSFADKFLAALRDEKPEEKAKETPIVRKKPVDSAGQVESPSNEVGHVHGNDQPSTPTVELKNKQPDQMKQRIQVNEVDLPTERTFDFYSYASIATLHIRTLNQHSAILYLKNLEKMLVKMGYIPSEKFTGDISPEMAESIIDPLRKFAIDLKAAMDKKQEEAIASGQEIIGFENRANFGKALVYYAKDAIGRLEAKALKTMSDDEEGRQTLSLKITPTFAHTRGDMDVKSFLRVLDTYFSGSFSENKKIREMLSSIKEISPETNSIKYYRDAGASEMERQVGNFIITEPYAKDFARFRHNG